MASQMIVQGGGQADLDDQDCGLNPYGVAAACAEGDFMRSERTRAIAAVSQAYRQGANISQIMQGAENKVTYRNWIRLIGFVGGGVAGTVAAEQTLLSIPVPSTRSQLIVKAKITLIAPDYVEPLEWITANEYTLSLWNGNRTTLIPASDLLVLPANPAVTGGGPAPGGSCCGLEGNAEMPLFILNPADTFEVKLIPLAATPGIEAGVRMIVTMETITNDTQ